MASEFSLIARHFTRPTPNAVLGPGDDCALLAPSPGMELAVTTDMLVAGTHFLPDADPEALGWKTVAVNLSDLAAMGAQPRWVLLAGALPDADGAWLEAFARGLFACADAFGAELVGGDTTRGPLCLCLTAIGEVPTAAALRRDGARVGDELWVSGTPGLAALGLRSLLDGVGLPDALREAALAALHRPQARVALGLALRGIATAAIDVSDGLLGDLGHILERSALSAEIAVGELPALPDGADPGMARRCQLAGGDDYELVFAAPPAAHGAIAALARELQLPLTRFGRIVAGAAGTITLRDPEGQVVDFAERGYDHFA